MPFFDCSLFNVFILLTLLVSCVRGDDGDGDGDGDSDRSGFWKSNSKLGALILRNDPPDSQSLRGIRMMATWSARCGEAASANGITCLPQLWGYQNLDDFKQVAKSANPPVFLTFNEPDQNSQSNLSPSTASNLWKDVLKPLRDRGHAIGSPATVASANGLSWLRQFHGECQQCVWDITCMHWYDTSFDNLKRAVTDYHNAFGKPIIISEFAPLNFNGGNQLSSDKVLAFYKQAIPWLNSQPYVYAYFPNGMSPNIISGNAELVNPDGSLNGLGHYIVNEGT